MNPLKKVEPHIEAFQQESAFINIDTPQGPIRAATAGMPKNPPVIFVHGTPGSWEGWAYYLRNETLRSKYHLIAIDRIGFGGSQPGRVESSMTKQVDVLAAALSTNFSGQPAILVGHSLGGAVIARMAMDQPSKVKGLIFISSSVDPELENFAWYQHVLRWRIFSWMLPQAWQVCNEELYPFKHELELMEPLWPKIQAPSVILQGDKDSLVPVGNLDFLLKHLKPEWVVRASRLTGVNHFFLWDTPKLVLDAFTDLENFESKKQAP